MQNSALSSVESQKGFINIQYIQWRYIEKQKEAIAVQSQWQ